MTTHAPTRTRDLPARLRDSATDIEARARRDLAGYPDRMQPFLDEAADLRAAADRLEALERLVVTARAVRHRLENGLDPAAALAAMDEDLVALEADQ